MELLRLLQPKDFHIPFDLLEFLIAGDQLNAAVLCQRRSETVGVRHLFARLKMAACLPIPNRHARCELAA